MSSQTLRRALAVGGAAALLAACSGEDVAERALEMVDGVEGVDIDSESGSISVEGQDGESFDVDIDEDGESTTITTEDGTMTAAPNQELPAEIAAVFEAPDGFNIGAVTDQSSDGDRVILAQGEIQGEWQALFEDLEARVRAGSWEEIQVNAIVEGAMGGITAGNDDGSEVLGITLLQDEGSTTAVLSITYSPPDVEG